MGPSSGVFGPEARLTRQPGSIVLPHRSERPYRAALEPGTLQSSEGGDRVMADGGTALRTSDLVLTLVQSGCIAGLEMQPVLSSGSSPETVRSPRPSAS